MCINVCLCESVFFLLFLSIFFSCSLPTFSSLLLSRSAAMDSLSVEDFIAELKSSLLFQDSTLTVLKNVWKSEGPSLCSLPKQSLSVGEVRTPLYTCITCAWNVGTRAAI